jgi:crotonobetainyl-CoA:carnitine CoA-transferase CaiB-like acyl-CoA transferase
VPIVDLMTGMYAAVAILAALARRAETGQGETIDLAMLDVAAAMLANQAMNYLVSDKAPKRGGNRHPNIQPQDVFACADGHFVLAVGNDGQFAKLCEAIGRPELALDQRFKSNSGRVSSNTELTTLLSEEFTRYTKSQITERLDRVGVPSAAINDVPQVLQDPQILFRSMLRHLPHPISQTVPQVVSPMRLTDAPLEFDRAPPLLGQHTDEVLAELGIEAPERRSLYKTGII